MKLDYFCSNNFVHFKYKHEPRTLVCTWNRLFTAECEKVLLINLEDVITDLVFRSLNLTSINLFFWSWSFEHVSRKLYIPLWLHFTVFIWRQKTLSPFQRTDYPYYSFTSFTPSFVKYSALWRSHVAFHTWDFRSPKLKIINTTTSGPEKRLRPK